MSRNSVTIQQVRGHLDQSWAHWERSKREGTHSDSANAAFERLHFAVSLLLDKVASVDSAASHANNVASCLANGIQPD